jgi:Acetyltransferase (GNAT) domain
MNADQTGGFKTEVLERDQIVDAVWNDFISHSPQAAPYGCTWYLDVVWHGWKAIIVSEKGEWLAVMPLKISRKYGISYVFNPQFCQYVGLFFGEIAKKNATQSFALKKKLVKAMVEALPKEVKVFNVKFAPEFDYPLPFHWAGYELHIRYSYWLDNQADKSALLKNFEERTRTYINKALKSGLMAQPVEGIDSIVELATARSAYPLNGALLKRLWAALRQQQTGTALEVRDEAGRLHAGLIYQQFGHKLIHLFSAFDADLSSQGGMSLAIWRSIEAAGPEVQVIDFEGSMLEPVEHFFRGFGTRPVPHLQIKKNSFPKPLHWLMK